MHVINSIEEHYKLPKTDELQASLMQGSLAKEGLTTFYNRALKCINNFILRYIGALGPPLHPSL